MEQIKTEKKSLFLSVVKGLFSGFFLAIPFMNKKHLDKLFLRKEENKFENYFKYSFSYLLAASLGALLFFYIPLSTLCETYHTGFYFGLFFMILIFLAYEVFNAIKIGYISRKHLISGLIILGVSFALSFAFSFIKFKAPIEEGVTPFLILLIISIGSFLCSFSGISPSSLFVYFSFYLSGSTYLKDTLYQGLKSVLFLFVIFAIGTFIGNTFYRFYSDKLEPLKEEKYYLNIGLYSSYALYMAIFKLRGPYLYESETITKQAQIITIISTITAFIVFGLILTIYQYPWKEIKFIKRKKR